MSIRICVGGGSFGTLAALQGRAQADRTLVIDIDAQCRARPYADRIVVDPNTILDSHPGSIYLLVGDGARVLLDILDRWVPDLVVAASRGHLAAHLAVEHVMRRGKELLPSTDLVPYVIEGLPSGSVIINDLDQAVVVTSYMPSSLQCTEGCMQPPVCPVTGRDISVPMHAAIHRAVDDKVDLPIVLKTIHSDDVASVSGRELVAMLSSLDRMGNESTTAIATACGCHGFINLLRLFDH